MQQQQQASPWRAASTACDVQDRDRLVQRAPSGTPPVLVVKTAASPLEGKRIGFIGSGQMAEALARGLLSRELIEGHQVMHAGTESSLLHFMEHMARRVTCSMCLPCRTIPHLPGSC